MKKNIILLLVSIISQLSFSQSLEGKLTYKVDFKINMEASFGLSEKDMIEHLKKSGDYFDTMTIQIKNGNYEKRINSKDEKRIVYKSKVNKIYTFDQGFDHVIITDANNYNSLKIAVEKPKVIQDDTLTTIMNKDCTSITLDWNSLGKETYFYNKDFLKIDAKLFSLHNFEYFNEVLNLTNAYPIQIVKSLNKMIEIKMTLIDYSMEEISDSAFEIPELEPTDKEYADMIMGTTGNEVMRIKKQ